MFDVDAILQRRLSEYASLTEGKLDSLVLPSYLVWEQGNSRYALPLDQLVGVAKLRITPVPLSGGSLVGLTYYLDAYWPVRSVEALGGPLKRTFTGNILFLRHRRMGLWCDQELTLSSSPVSENLASLPLSNCPGLVQVGYCADGSILLGVEAA